MDEEHHAGNHRRQQAQLSVVLCLGCVNDYCAYAGCGDDDWVQRNGDKLSFEEACCHFPRGQLVKERYRL